MNKEVYTKMSEQQLEKAPASNEPVQESMKDYEDQFDIANPWNIVQRYMDEKTTLTLKVEGIVNGGVIVKVEGLRGFIPASRLSLTYIENLEDYLLKDVRVRVIDADESENRLVLSAREILKEEEAQEKAEKISKIHVGDIMEGEVESIQSYGAFIRFADGLSGLVHVSQVCEKRIKTPADVLKKGDTVKVKVIGIKDGKLSLSIKALIEAEEEKEPEIDVPLPKSEEIGTKLGDLFKNISL